MYPELQAGDFVEALICKFLRITLIQNMFIGILLAACGTVHVFFAKHPTPLDKNIYATKCLECHENIIKDGANCLEHPAVNPHVMSEGQSIHWLSGSQSVIVLERVWC
jgi:hypothetical protein